MSVVVNLSLIVVAIVGKKGFDQISLRAYSPDDFEVVKNEGSAFLAETLVDPIVTAEA